MLSDAPRPLRIAFPLLGRGGWSGGANYLRNMLKVINGRLAGQIEPSLIVSRDEAEGLDPALIDLVGGRVIVDGGAGVAGRGRRLLSALALGRDRDLHRALAAAAIDCVFESATFYGWRPGMPVISWIPDFQHRAMPEMFPRGAWWRREIGFQAQVRSGRHIMLSSETARRELAQHYHASPARSHVVRFATDIDIAGHVGRAQETVRKYNLPNRFFYLPNQFWRHKRHGLVLDGLALLAAQGKLGDLPPVIMSGPITDARNPGHFEQMMAQAQQLGLDGHFLHLGLIPYSDVLDLNAACFALINPSAFEGWSTPIEEAKALGTPMLLSDIAIHREQSPSARFFGASAAEVATALCEAAAGPDRDRADVQALMAAQAQRINGHAEAMMCAFLAAVSGKRPCQPLCAVQQSQPDMHTSEAGLAAENTGAA